MGGRDYPPDDWVPDDRDGAGWDDLPGWAQRALAEHGITSAPTGPPETELEREVWAQCQPADGVDSPELGDELEYRRGYEDGYDRGRVAAMNQGFSDAWDGGWKACQKWFVNEQRLRSHRRAGLMRGGFCGKTGADNPGDCSCLDFDLAEVRWPDPPPQEGKEEVARAHGLETLPGWGTRDWGAETRLEHQGGEVEPVGTIPEACEDSEYCFPVRLPGGWWCRACDKPLRLVRPLYQSDREP